MSVHIPFPSIGQFKQTVKYVNDQVKYYQCKIPTIRFHGAVKTHGTNSAFIMDMSTGETWAQSRERVLDLVQDNAGFCAFTEKNKEDLKLLCKLAHNKRPASAGYVQVYGEWCGGNIQKGVGVSYLPKMFIVFGIRISENAESQRWFTSAELNSVFNDFSHDVIMCIEEFPTWDIDIPFTNPQSVQNLLVELTEKVEKECPVARKLLGSEFDKELIGEGIVYTAVSCDVPEINIDGLRHKIKGERHSSSKVKTLAEVDTEKLASVQEFIEYACTENRIKQGVDIMVKDGVPLTPQNTGVIIKWVMGDIIKEETDTMVKSGLCTKDVTSGIASTVRNYYLSLL